MTTQGIMPSAVEGRTAGLKMISKTPAAQKANPQDFSEMMNRRSEQFQGNKDAVKEPKIQKDQLIANTGKENQTVSLENQSATAEEYKVPDLSETEEKVVELLADTFGLTEEDIVDIMEQLGICPMDFLISETMTLNEFTLLDVDTIKDFVMEVYGISEDTAFLMNDTLTEAFSSLKEGFHELISELFMTETPEQIVLSEQAVKSLLAANEGEVENIPKEAVSSEQETMIEFDIPKQTDSAMSDTGNGSDSSFSNMTSSQTAVQTESHEVAENHVENHENHDSQQFVQTFSERLNEAAFEIKTETANPAEMMNRIVSQIVNHVRIRVIPQSTSMELMLNPASLGRVLLTVSQTANGVSTATLTVQNELAKEAIETQMITLQQTFEEKGMKVASIEVTVSEFGFKKNDEGSGENGSSEQTNRRNKNRRFRIHTEESVSAEEETIENSENLVDYTA